MDLTEQIVQLLLLPASFRAERFTPFVLVLTGLVLVMATLGSEARRAVKAAGVVIVVLATFGVYKFSERAVTPEREGRRAEALVAAASLVRGESVFVGRYPQACVVRRGAAPPSESGLGAVPPSAILFRCSAAQRDAIEGLLADFARLETAQ